MYSAIPSFLSLFASVFFSHLSCLLFSSPPTLSLLLISVSLSIFYLFGKYYLIYSQPPSFPYHFFSHHPLYPTSYILSSLFHSILSYPSFYLPSIIFLFPLSINHIHYIGISILYIKLYNNINILIYNPIYFNFLFYTIIFKLSILY